MEVILEVILEVFIVPLLLPVFKGIAKLFFEAGFFIYGLLGMDWGEERKEDLSVFSKIVISLLGACLLSVLAFLLFV